MTDSVYQFAVKASNAIGDGLLSSAIIIRAASVPNAPLVPTKASSTTSSISINWLAPSYNGGNALTQYSVYIDDGLGGALTLLTTTANATVLTFTASSLIISRTYKFSVTAWNQVGQSLNSPSASILCATVPSAPAQPITAS